MSWKSGEINPNGCLICNADKHRHCQIWAEGHGYHSYMEPSDAVRLVRMKLKRELRLQAEEKRNSPESRVRIIE